jgi:hypothetical protein
VVRDPDSVQTGRDTLFHRESSENRALTPTLSHPKRAGEGEDWDGTRDRDGTLSIESKVQGRRSEARNPDFGLWTAGLWTNTGTGHVVSPRKSRRIRPWQRPVRTSSGRAAGRDRNGTGLNCTERDGIGTGSVRERSRRDTRPDGTWGPDWSRRSARPRDANGTGHIGTGTGRD